MTDTNNGWPGKPGVPFNPEKDGRHWVSLLGSGHPQIMEWFSDAMVWADGWTVEACAKHLRYLGPCLTPDEVQNLRDDLAAEITRLRGLVKETGDLAALRAEEIARLRAACDAYLKTISLSQMRHGRILVGLERRNARQRRALAKLYQRRHDKNAALATARREGMEEAAKIADRRAADWAKSAIGKYINSKWDFQSRAEAGEEIAAAIRAAAEERKP
ncbi:MAG: hypothetical protein ING08_08145 [Roseomonas sp.]|nr:hypothetical protein [Roseomonas sp.]